MTQSGQILLNAGENHPAALLPPAGRTPIAGLHAKAAVELAERHMRSVYGGSVHPEAGNVRIKNSYRLWMVRSKIW